MEGTSDGFGIFLWVGSAGTGRDIPYHKASTLLLEKEYVARTEPEIEHDLALQDMKQYLCAILQCCDNSGQPLKGPLLYSLFLNELTEVYDWVATGEYNPQGIFHVHVLLRTGQRSDSVRRAMTTAFKNLMLTETFSKRIGKQGTVDCLKIARCHKPSSMFKYLMKGPLWLLSNSEKHLQLCYDIDEWNLAERFKQPEQKDSPDMNQMVKDIVDIIVAGNCKTFEDIIKKDPDTMGKYLHRPGLGNIVNNCIAYVKSTGGAWDIKLFNKYEPDPLTIHKCLLHQGIIPSHFDKAFWTWITKADTKRNCLVIQGPSNTGKSAFIQGLLECVPWGEIVNAPVFAWEGLLDAVIGVWQEPLLGPEQAEKFKQVAEGMNTSIPIKFKKPQMLKRTPLIITTNHDLWRWCAAEENMIRNRIFHFWFKYECLNQYYTPRTIEYGCECAYCTASRGCSSPTGESVPCNVQRTNEPLPSGEQSTRTSTSPDVGTGPLLDPGEGTSRSYLSTYGCSSSSATLGTTDRGKSPSKSSSTIDKYLGFRRPDRSSDTNIGKDHTITGPRDVLEPDGSTGNDGNASSGDRCGETGELIGRGNGSTTRHSSPQHHSVPQLGLDHGKKAKQKSIRVPAKKRRVDREMGARVGAIKLDMHVPLKEDWQQYLSFLLQKHG
uniref:Nonstructural protein n=1 Tax=Parvoviridae sp. TaxID=1940570 RepID=A0A7D3UKA0_9VIRU|nr:MAG: nonstructural protein [Parvoviridae sp.]